MVVHACNPSYWGWGLKQEVVKFKDSSGKGSESLTENETGRKEGRKEARKEGRKEGR
jgi:hypothetical protein